MEQIPLLENKKSEKLTSLEQHKLAEDSALSLSIKEVQKAARLVRDSNQRIIKYIRENPGSKTREIINNCNTNNPHHLSKMINKELINRNSNLQIIKLPPPAGRQSDSWSWYLVKSDILKNLNNHR